MNETRRHVHEMIDRLPPAQLSAVAGLLESILNGKEIGEDEERSVEEARQWLHENNGKGIPHAEILAEFGLTLDDFQQMGKQRAERR